MDPALVRGQGVVGTDTRTPAAMDELEALYRSARDDVFAYATTLLRDRAAAEEVTAVAFERALSRRRTFDRRRGEARLAVRDRAQRRTRRTAPPAAGGRAGGRPGRRGAGAAWRRRGADAPPHCSRRGAHHAPGPRCSAPSPPPGGCCRHSPGSRSWSPQWCCRSPRRLCSARGAWLRFRRRWRELALRD